VNGESKDQLIRKLKIFEDAHQNCLIAVTLALRTVLERHPKNHNIVAEVMTCFWANLSSNYSGGAIDMDTLETYCEKVGFDQVTANAIKEKYHDLYIMLRKYKED